MVGEHTTAYSLTYPVALHAKSIIQNTHVGKNGRYVAGLQNHVYAFSVNGNQKPLPQP